MNSCNLCGAPASKKCTGCGHVFYCSVEHQRADWKAGHKLACLHLQSKEGKRWESDIGQGEYVGTFRWSTKTDFMQLPPLIGAPPPLESMEEYVGGRLPADKEGKIIVEPATLDALSFPLSLLHGLRQALTMDSDFKDELFKGKRELTIIAAGCSERAEEHILRLTNYWQEISNYMPSFIIHLWMLGPEMSTKSHMEEFILGPKMTATCFRGKLSTFMTAHFPPSSSTTPKKLLLAVFNPGMASGDDALKASWRRDLDDILDRNLPVLFTCASDHTDLKNERQLLSSLRAHYLLFPRPNKFVAATHMHPPGARDTGSYAANAFIYIIRGREGGQQSASSKSSQVGTKQVPASAGPSPSTPQGYSSPASKDRAAVPSNKPHSASTKASSTTSKASSTMTKPPLTTTKDPSTTTEDPSTTTNKYDTTTDTAGPVQQAVLEDAGIVADALKESFAAQLATTSSTNDGPSSNGCGQDDDNDDAGGLYLPD